jgi:methionyl-tRNA formyltransferase
MNKTLETTESSGKISTVFFGTGPVAAESLRLLVEDFEIEAVITKPRPPHHRGSVPVLEMAEALSLPVITAENSTELTHTIQSASVKSQFAILIDFGIIVNQRVIDSFPLGIINSHFSLLPQWRGADPITFSILSGQKLTGVSLMQVVQKLDEGDVLGFGLYELSGAETGQSLTHDLIQLSAALLRDHIPQYLVDQKAVPQDQLARQVPGIDYPQIPSYSRKLTKQDGVMDLHKPAVELEREVRAYLGWPGSRTVIAGKDVVIIAAHVADNNVDNVDKKSTFIADKQLCLQTADGILIIEELKPAGKPAMSAAAFLAGYGHLV